MIERERPDIVHIVTQPADRAALMHLAADLSVPAAVVEKPLAAGVTDWRSLVELERRCATRFTVSHQFRWHVDLTRCREALQSGRLGAVRFLETSCGMNVSNQGTHALNYIMSLNGDARVQSVFGTASGMSGSDPTHPAPDTSVAHLLFDNGVRCLWHHGPTAPLIGDPETVYQHVRVAAYADRGRVLYEEFRNWEIVGARRHRVRPRRRHLESQQPARAGRADARHPGLAGGRRGAAGHRPEPVAARVQDRAGTVRQHPAAAPDRAGRLRARRRPVRAAHRRPELTDVRRRPPARSGCTRTARAAPALIQMELANVRIVLVRPEEGRNVGAACRAAKTMGIERLHLVAAEGIDRHVARVVAVHAADLLDRAVVCGSVAEAVTGCTLAAAVTRRDGKRRKYRIWTAEEAGPAPGRAAARGRSRWCSATRRTACRTPRWSRARWRWRSRRRRSSRR